MVRFKFACLALLAIQYMDAWPLRADGLREGIAVLEPVGGSPRSSDRMRGARERLKDVLPGKHG